MINLEASVVYGGIATGGLMLGWLLRGAKSWFGVSIDVTYIKGKVKELCADIDAHTRDTDHHLVRGREDTLISAMRENFQQINTKLDTINARCEKRLESCQGHFSVLDQKIASGRSED